MKRHTFVGYSVKMCLSLPAYALSSCIVISKRDQHMLAECFCSIMSNVMNKLVKTCQKVLVHSVLFIFAV